MNMKTVDTKKGKISLDVRKESDKMTVVTHKSLEDAFNDLSLKMKFTPIASTTGAVFLCEIEGITEIGEAQIEKSSDFGGKYPYTLAFQRAFDRCMIKVLGLSKTYSTNEIPVSEWDSEYVPEENIVVETEDIFENPPVETTEENPVIFNEDFEEVVDEEPSEDAGTYVFAQGKFKGKTINELFMDNPSYLEYCAFKGTKTSAEVKEAIMKFYKQKGLHSDKM